jgi:hypothetical protein
MSASQRLLSARARAVQAFSPAQEASWLTCIQCRWTSLLQGWKPEHNNVGYHSSARRTAHSASADWQRWDSTNVLGSAPEIASVSANHSHEVVSKAISNPRGSLGFSNVAATRMLHTWSRTRRCTSSVAEAPKEQVEGTAEEQKASPRPNVDDDKWKLEYEGALSSTIRTLKMVSLSTAVLSLVGSPLYIMATMDGQYTAVKVMAASGFTCFGLFTTGMPDSDTAMSDVLVKCHARQAPLCRSPALVYRSVRAQIMASCAIATGQSRAAKLIFATHVRPECALTAQSFSRRCKR